MPMRIRDKRTGAIRFVRSEKERSEVHATKFFGQGHTQHLQAFMKELLGVLTPAQRNKLKERLVEIDKHCKDCHGE